MFLLRNESTMRVLGCMLLLVFIMGARADDSAFNGKWAIEVEPPHQKAMWLEIRGAGNGDIAGRCVGAVGGRSQPLIDANIRDGVLSFGVERYLQQSQTWLRATNTVRLFKDGIKGTTSRQNGTEIRWSGRRPDVLKDTDDGSWKPSVPIVLFDGKDMLHWHAGQNEYGRWIVSDGVLRNQGKAPNLVSNEKFFNFRLHVEFRVASKSNSGIGLRSRYEIQILDDFGQPPSIHGNGALYSTIKPSLNASQPSTARQTFDIVLIGRDLTVVLNGTSIIDKREVRGLTAMAMDAREASAGPLLLQGDHGPIEFYKIVVTPLVR
ncbi:MAG: hypothetical protein CMN58_04945 [Solibacterales bacterium]|nr:hypothetical protein [Bryobacterales bacterium]